MYLSVHFPLNFFIILKIENGSIIASIDASNGMVTFGDQRRQYHSFDDLDLVNARVEEGVICRLPPSFCCCVGQLMFILLIH